MDKLEYNILLEEAGIYSKRKLNKDESVISDIDLVYDESETKDRYEIIPTELSPDEIKLALMAKQTQELRAISSKLTVLLVLLIIPFVIGVLFLLSALS